MPGMTIPIRRRKIIFGIRQRDPGRGPFVAKLKRIAHKAEWWA